ncbi:MAG: TIGR03032 family protein [Xanthomonadales bacterium]|nr:hypothetical protein [Xanthomonadales bacterium]MCC6594035.1 TIGR03032 family protein [Xanthomonadales bacterium]MCE7931659.1 TIGR03032 family protein [Xanthomonadales bacterium PRO6]
MQATTFHASRHFAGWLAEQGTSLAFSTYQTGKLFLLGLDATGQPAVFNRTLARAMGLAVHGSSLWVATLYQLWRFEDALTPGAGDGTYDRWYLPQLAWTTGDVDTHDVAIDADGDPVFVATLLSCLARPDARYSLRPIWRPPFVSQLAAEDRCHLNGLAMRAGQPAVVTCVGRSDAREGWREHRDKGGLAIDVASGQTIAGGLSMPHSPRWHAGRLWLLNAGSGEFGQVELDSGRFLPITFCPGFLRGLCFVGRYALVGISALRENRSFSGLALETALARRGVSARCALLVIDLARGEIVHELAISGATQELFDVAALPGCRRPGAIGFASDEIRRTLVLPPESRAACPSHPTREEDAGMHLACARERASRESDLLDPRLSPLICRAAT